MNCQRRRVVGALFGGGAAIAASSLGVLAPRRAWAAWPQQAFEADKLEAAIESLFASSQAEPSGAIDLAAPTAAENGAVVPVSISTEMDNVETIAVFVARNPSPLAASFELGPGVVPEISTRIKMAETSDVVALVKARGKLYRTQRRVKVTVGACGGQ